MSYTLKVEADSPFPPLIACFPPWATDNVNSTTFSVLQQSNDQGKKALVLNAAQKQLQYSGAHTGQIDPVKYAIGIVDPDKKTIALHNATFIPLKPRLRNPPPVVEEEEVPDITLKDPVAIEAASRKRFLEGRQALVDTFGSKRSRQMLLNREMNKITEDRVSIGDEVKKHLQAAEDDKAGKVQTNNPMLPPHDADAKEASMIYKMDEIVTAEDRQVCGRAWSELAKSLKKSPDTFFGRVAGALAGQDRATRHATGAVVAWCHALVAFYTRLADARFTVRNPDGLAEAAGVPPALVARFVALFCEPQARSDARPGTPSAKPPVSACSRPAQSRLLNYVCVLCLAAMNWEMPSQWLALLAQALRMDADKVKLHMKFVGARTVAVKGRDDDDAPAAKVVRLVAPLKVPEARLPRSRARK